MQPKAIVVDDDDASARATAKLLQRLGWDAAISVDPEHAVGLSLSGDVGLVSLDITMPKLDGYQVLALIRSHEHTRRLPSVPVITITGRTSDDDRADALASGFAAHLSKPVFVNELRDALDRASTLRDALHRTRYTWDISSVDERIRHLFPRQTPDRPQAIAGLALALEQQVRDLLRQSLLRAMHGNPDAAQAPLIRLSELVSAMGAHGARKLCRNLADQLASGGQPMQTAAVQLRAEIDRLIFTLRERVLR